MKVGDTLYTYLCEKLGIPYAENRHQYIVDVQKERFVKVPLKNQDPDGEQRFETVIEKYTVQEERVRIDHYIGDSKIDLVLSKFLEDNQVLLILDGLDELPGEIATEVVDQIGKLSYYLSTSKMLITSRPDYVRRNMDGFKLCQLCNLSDDQIRAICGLYKIDTDRFYKMIACKSYFELARRPLFLSYLILLYPNLPVSSAEVYRKIIELILDWDQDRGFDRSEVFAEFDFFKKRDLVSHLAFNLTFKLRKPSFSQSDLRETYRLIHERFRLPAKDAELVCNELENHTGLIVKAFDKSYEFSHFVLQEYLCAYYLASTIYNRKFLEYLQISPSAIGMAIALSQNANDWLNSVIFDYSAVIESHPGELLGNAETTLKALLRKILAEKPYFEVQRELGYSVMLLAKHTDCTDIELNLLINEFLEEKNVFKSTLLAINSYSNVRIDEKTSRVWFGGNFDESDMLATAALPLQAYNKYFRA